MTKNLIIMSIFFPPISALVLDVFLMEFLMGLSSFPSPSVPDRLNTWNCGHTHTHKGGASPLVLPLTAGVRDQLGCRAASGSCTTGNERLIISVHITTGQVKSWPGFRGGKATKSVGYRRQYVYGDN